MLLSDADLERLIELERAATPAPWEVLHKFNIVAPDPRGGILSPLTTSWEAVPRVENFTLVAECRNALPDLLQEIRTTRNSNAAWRTATGCATPVAAGERIANMLEELSRWQAGAKPAPRRRIFLGRRGNTQTTFTLQDGKWSNNGRDYYSDEQLNEEKERREWTEIVDEARTEITELRAELNTVRSQQ